MFWLLIYIKRSKTIDFTRENVRDLKDKFKKHVQTFLDENDIDAGYGGVTFTPDEMRFKLTFQNKMVADDRPEDEIIKARFEVLAGMIGMKREDWGKEFKMQNKTYIVWDLKPKAKKNNVIIKLKGTDKLYVASAVFVNSEIS